VFGEGHDPDSTQIAAELGTRWDTLRYGIKPYAAMGGLHAAIDAVLALRAAAPIDPAKISHIRVDVSDAAFQHGGFDITRPIEPITAQMSPKYTTPAVILDHAALIAQYRSLSTGQTASIATTSGTSSPRPRSPTSLPSTTPPTPPTPRA
jgi:aconitate decarboxylase